MSDFLANPISNAHLIAIVFMILSLSAFVGIVHDAVLRLTRELHALHTQIAFSELRRSMIAASRAEIERAQAEAAKLRFDDIRARLGRGPKPRDDDDEIEAIMKWDDE